MNNAIYPGSFDPITNGHLDILNRASKLYERLYLAISNDSSEKSKLFSIEDRMKLAKESVESIPNIEIISFNCLIVDLCDKHDCNVIIRGLRALSDYDFEFKMALMNRNLNNQITTLFMMPHEKYTHISSSLLKEVFSLGGDIPSDSLIIPSTPPMFTSFPSLTLISDNTPALGAGTSTVILSVSISTKGSSI